MAKLTITFEDTDIGFAFYPSEELKAAAERFRKDPDSVTSAEMFAATAFMAVHHMIQDVVSEIQGAGHDMIMAHAPGATLEESVENVKKLLAEEPAPDVAECDGECTRCPTCTGNKTVH